MDFRIPTREKNYGKSRCPVHCSPNRNNNNMSALLRRKSFDCAYLSRTEMAAQFSTLRRESVGGDRQRTLRYPFLHSHSVNCAIEGSMAQPDESKTKSVVSVAAQTPRPRPNVLELYPNHNMSTNVVRRRFSRSSERSYDFEDCCYELHSYASTLPSSVSKAHNYLKSSSKVLHSSPNAFTNRRDPGCQGRLGNIRRGLSLLSLCAGEVDEDDDLDDGHQRKILRPPTRHFYQRGISGMPVKRPAKYMGLAF